MYQIFTARAFCIVCDHQVFKAVMKPALQGIWPVLFLKQVVYASFSLSVFTGYIEIMVIVSVIFNLIIFTVVTIATCCRLVNQLLGLS